VVLHAEPAPGPDVAVHDARVGEGGPLDHVDLPREPEQLADRRADQEHVDRGVEDQVAALAPVAALGGDLGPSGRCVVGRHGAPAEPATGQDPVDARERRVRGQVGAQLHVVAQALEVATDGRLAPGGPPEGAVAGQQAAGEADQQQDRQRREPPRREHVEQAGAVEDPGDGGPGTGAAGPPRRDGVGDQRFLRDERRDDRRHGEAEQQHQRGRHLAQPPPHDDERLPRAGDHRQPRPPRRRWWRGVNPGVGVGHRAPPYASAAR
jgi:hypothetical protein